MENYKIKNKNKEGSQIRDRESTIRKWTGS